jgi:hypothetical protein
MERYSDVVCQAPQKMPLGSLGYSDSPNNWLADEPVLFHQNTVQAHQIRTFLCALTSYRYCDTLRYSSAQKGIYARIDLLGRYHLSCRYSCGDSWWIFVAGLRLSSRGLLFVFVLLFLCKRIDWLFCFCRINWYLKPLYPLWINNFLHCWCNFLQVF